MAKRKGKLARKPKAETKAKTEIKSKPAVEAQEKYRVSATPDADKGIAKLDKPERLRVLEFMDSMVQEPTKGAAPLRHFAGQAWKKRLVDIRVIFHLDVKRREVIVLAVRWRRSDTYDDLEKLIGQIKKK